MSGDPAPDALDLALHERLLAREPLATFDLYDRFAPQLKRWLGGKFRTTDDDLIASAVDDALFDYFVHPERFDGSRRSLAGYLRMVALRDLQNLRARQQGRREHELVTEDVELEALGGNTPVDDLLDLMIEAESQDTLWERLAMCAENDDELTVLRLMWDLERSTPVYAAELGFAHLPPEEQRARVYQIKDRLTKRARRRLGERDV